MLLLMGPVQITIIILSPVLLVSVCSKPQDAKQSSDFTYSQENKSMFYDGSECRNSRGEYGVCTSRKNCKSSIQFVASDLCSYSIYDGLYCCTNISPEETNNGQEEQKQGSLTNKAPIQLPSQPTPSQLETNQGLSLDQQQLNPISAKAKPQPDVEAYKTYATVCSTKDLLFTRCTALSECINRTAVHIDDICFYGETRTLYCCEAASYDLSPSQLEVTGKQKVEKRPIEKICDQYYPPPGSVGGSAGSGGVLSLPREHPHMAAIGWTDEFGQISWECGGSVVTSNFILTAAHCTKFRGKNPDIARTGDLHLLKDDPFTDPSNFRITEVFIHPSYTEEAIYHDIALLKMKQTSGPSYNGLPACIWPLQDAPTIGLEALGYGTDSYSGPKTNELFQFYLDLLPQNECIRRVPPISDYLSNGIISQQFCAEDPQHIMDTCQGDSGGPIQFRTTHYLRKPYIFGITSFGLYCAGSSPGVYTRTSTYLDWIENVLLSDFNSSATNF